MKKNNKGFSLVELIVTFAILAIIGVAIYGFMSVSNRQFVSTTNDVGLQYDQQIVVNQIRDYILESSNSIYYDDIDEALYTFKQTNETIAAVEPTPEGEPGSPAVDYAYRITKIHFVDPNGGVAPGEEGYDSTLTSDITVKSYLVDKAAADSYLASHSDDDETNDESAGDLYMDDLSSSENEKVLGSNVQSLVYDFSEIDNNKVSFDIVFYSDGKEFKSHQVVSLRNSVTLSDSGFVVDTTKSTVTSSIDSVTILRDGVALNTLAGDHELKHIGKYGASESVNVKLEANVAAKVASKYMYNFGVIWKAFDEAGNPYDYDTDGIGIGENDGTLKIASTVATDTKIVVVATSIDDPNKSATVSFVVDDEGAYPEYADLSVSFVDMNGYRLFTCVPKIIYTSVKSESGTNMLEGEQVLNGSMKIEWQLNTELPEVAHGIESILDEKNGRLSLTDNAEGMDIKIRFKVKELKADGTELYSEWKTLNTDGIQEYVAPETLKLSIPGESNRADTTVASVSWLTTPKTKVKYYWKVYDDVDNTSSGWYDATLGAISTNFNKTVTVDEDIKSDKSYFKKYGSSLSGVYGDFGDGIDGNDWYESTESQRFANIYVQSFLYWQRTYKISVMCFAVSEDGKTVYDASGTHDVDEGKPIVPVVASTYVPRVQFIVEPTTKFRGVEGYKTSKIIQQNKKAPGEQRVFNYRVVGLNVFADINGNSSLATDSKSLNTHYIFYNSAGNKVNINRYRGTTGYVLAGESRVDKEVLDDIAGQFMFELDIVKYDRDTTKVTEFFKFNPQKMTFYMTLNQNIEIDGVNIKNSIDSSMINYNLMYKDNQ